MFVHIVVFALMVLLLVMAYFQKQNKAIREKHCKRVGKLEKSISLNRSQINIRQKNMDRYDLLRYNLDEALVVQEKIIV